MSNPDLNGANLSRISLRNADLRHASLIDANLSGVSMYRADLGGADLSNADLTGVDLNHVALHKACLTTADLSRAHFTDGTLQDANLRGAILDEANFSNTTLVGADLSFARLQGTLFARTSLNGVLGLEDCAHAGPSSLDYWTLAKSNMLPLSFLRGCGLPDDFIAYLPSLLSQGIQFHSCFISYSTKDQEFADRLYADLQNKGVRCWFAPHDLQGGLKLHEQIDEAIQMHDRLLLLLSEASMDSEWVKTEIGKARKRERLEKRRMLFPVRLVDFETLRIWECFDADAGKDSAREIREYYVPDFSNWKEHDSYQREFGRLLNDLKVKTLPLAG